MEYNMIMEYNNGVMEIKAKISETQLKAFAQQRKL